MKHDLLENLDQAWADLQAVDAQVRAFLAVHNEDGELAQKLRATVEALAASKAIILERAKMAGMNIDRFLENPHAVD